MTTVNLSGYNVNGHDLQYLSYEEGSVLRISDANSALLKFSASHPWRYIGSYVRPDAGEVFDCFLRLYKNESKTFEFSNPNISIFGHAMLARNCMMQACTVS